MEIARGKNVERLAAEEIELISFAPCTSVNVERLFLVFNAFVSGRRTILDKALNKFMFVEYNSVVMFA